MSNKTIKQATAQLPDRAKDLRRAKATLGVIQEWETRVWTVSGVIVEDPFVITHVIIGGDVYPIDWQMKTTYYDDHGHRYPSTSLRGYVTQKKAFETRASVEEIMHNRFKVKIPISIMKKLTFKCTVGSHRR